LELSCIRQLIEEGKFGKDENICPHLLKKKSQRCGAPLSLVKDQFGGTIGRKKKIWWLFSCSHKCGLFHVCFMMKFASW
jgi:hypothetical protein